MLKHTRYSMILFVLLAACSKTEQAPTPAAPAAPAAAPATPAAATAAAPAAGGDLEKGEHVYKGTCSLCHATGTAGAPVLGSKADWEPRIAQGKETLYSHAINGFTGTKGAMPAKGANAGLSDEDVKAAVDYMTAKIK